MIVITAHDGGIQIRGHAYYAPEGYDIVCASISALMWAFIESVEQMTEDKIKYDVSPGRADIYFRNLSETGKVLMSSFFIGVQSVEAEYPDRVKVYRNGLGNERAGAERTKK